MYLTDPPSSPAADAMYAEDQESFGVVMNSSRLWAHQPGLHEGLFELLGRATKAAGLSVRDRGVLVSACSATTRDPCCSLAWGVRLADQAGADVAAAVLSGTDDGLDDRERALARWARKVAGEPGATGAADVQALRDAGYDDGQIAAITTYVALRVAYSAVDASLGVRDEPGLVAGAPEPVRAAVTWRRGDGAPGE